MDAPGLNPSRVWARGGSEDVQKSKTVLGLSDEDTRSAAYHGVPSLNCDATRAAVVVGMWVGRHVCYPYADCAALGNTQWE